LKILEATKKFTLDTLFPISCISCNKPGEWLCQKCFSKINLKNEQVCPYCEKKITPDGRTCFDCRKKYGLDGLLVASTYQNKIVSHAIHLYKYRFVEDFFCSLGNIMLKVIKNSELPLPDLIIPIPLHPRRLRWRGFNQSEMLAEHLSQKIAPGFPIALKNDIIERARYTQPQMKIRNQSQRKKNIENAFRVARNKMKSLKNKRILLVDDITTTGATLFECARTLKKSGAREVFAVVIARQGYK
jgi:competence protein ComFC